ncbi:hypothetical protein NicSoilB4_13380 [Arthrobacter sp. NicSoilB4]|uniref:hypothetical protein n=1 Tax=Arthrobacter sp. NicSoilB4 TaxID=2830997 RepID=UPI001CC82555|nr:hypothetical protein [Arthrobacter sp. NicSoilB4]BCW66575.1 hypothetical protein NicSoilB4_13380 [Arthrobacter sp. NicSoilB4]
MTRPDSNSPDPDSSDSHANQDDAVWLDLVARLEGRDPGAGTRTPEARTGKDDGERGDDGVDGELPDASLADVPRVDGPATPRPFRDFDPLGLSVAAPIELSAEERLAQSKAAGAASANAAAADGQEAASGPRDFEAENDDPFIPGEFVPEEPPSLAGADPMTVLAWLGAVGGPIALLMSAMFWRSAPLLAILGMVAAFAASVVFLIMKLPGEKDEHDDGARI